ncbi:hypothetical protein N7494_002511 [Penicillium frequentans]|uniref:Cell division control protein n=1 Tax=Penicillium frequentans TaxID=3151616 RepID=A0AAD6D5T3_9EURO|nr:hypothetical protein N7494_002511 [Penicillium glabrum]
MATTVLGKRNRSAVEAEALPVRTASKRRTVAPRVHREVAAAPPRRTRSTRLAAKNQDAEQPVDQENGDVINKISEKAHSKHTLRDDQGGSPTKIKSHFRTSKLVEARAARSTPADRIQDPTKESIPRCDPKFTSHSSPSCTSGSQICDSADPRHADIPPTPRPSATPTTTQTVYSQARQLFARGATSGRLVGRESEREKVSTFIEDCVESRKGGCLYISGPPGTGKSAMVNEVCQDMDLSNVKVSHVNCVSMRNSRDVYSKLIQDFCDESEVFKKSEADRIKDMFIPAKADGLFLVSLDEMDHLLQGDSGVLQSLFEWSLHNKSTLILIGIANALDLTDRSLPQLKAKNLRPILLPFLPYNAASIAGVITARLRSLLPTDAADSDPKLVPFLQPAAIQLCAKKVASQTGDLRKAFELIKRAIDVIEQETIQKLEKQAAESELKLSVLAENENLSSPSKSAAAPRPTTMSSYTPVTAPRASIAHIARITTSAFGQGTVQRLKNINLQQKAAICTLIALERKRREMEIHSTPSKNRSSAPTVKQAFDTYCTLCRNDNILHPLTATEFKDVLSNLETMGLVGDYQGRGRGGTLAGGSDVRRTPSKSGNVMSSPHKAMNEQGLICFVSQSEIESQIAGPGEGILRRLLRGDGL